MFLLQASHSKKKEKEKKENDEQLQSLKRSLIKKIRRKILTKNE